MNAVLRTAIADISIGTLIQGGYFAGAYTIGDKPFGLVVAPKAGDLKPAIWIAGYKDVPGARSYVDGLANTQAMAEAGSTLAKKILELEINGFTDWYLPAQDELELAYRAFKPTEDGNSQWGRSGINVSALPPTYPYSVDLPTQTSIEAFRADGAEAFAAEGYWTSTQHASYSSYAWVQGFVNGNQDRWGKDVKLRARAVRRFAI